MILKVVFYALIAMAISWLLVPLIGKLAFKVGAIDKPNQRKVHQKIMPRMGGLAIYLAFFAVVLVVMPLTKELVGLFLGSTILIAIGIWDDRKDIPPKVKLLGQIAAAVVAVLFGVRVEFMSSLFSDNAFHLAAFSIPVTIIWIVGITNAVNLIDGLDGLAAGTSIIAAVTMAIVGSTHAQQTMMMLAVILAGATLGFLQHNFHPAKIFMGDTGSMFLGYILSVLAIMGVAKSVTFISLITPILVLGIPIFDTTFAILRRTLNKKPIFKPDKEHLHHCLLNMGLSHRGTVLVIYGINIFLATSGLLMLYATTSQAMLLLVIVSTIVLVGARKLGIIRLKTPAVNHKNIPEETVDHKQS